MGLFGKRGRVNRGLVGKEWEDREWLGGEGVGIDFAHVVNSW